MADKFQSNAPGLSSPVTQAFEVTPNNNDDFVQPPRALWLNSAGTVRVIMLDEESDANTLDFVLPAGCWHPMRVRRILATGTDTNLGIHGGY